MGSLVPFTEHLYLHALLKQAEGLCEVADAELILRVLPHVLHFEVEPLLVPFRVGVHFAKQVVLLDHGETLGSLHIQEFVVDWKGLDALKVAALDSRVKS